MQKITDITKAALRNMVKVDNKRRAGVEKDKVTIACQESYIILFR